MHFGTMPRRTQPVPASSGQAALPDRSAEIAVSGFKMSEAAPPPPVPGMGGSHDPFWDGFARLSVLRGTLLTLVRRDGRDLTARQLTVFLTIYGDHAVHTVSSLAEYLNVARPGMTRVLDRLVEYQLVARQEDTEDRRRVLVRRTEHGASLYRELAEVARRIEPAPAID
jgi:DNA-binding MarR family transcriptional regulator